MALKLLKNISNSLFLNNKWLPERFIQKSKIHANQSKNPNKKFLAKNLRCRINKRPKKLYGENLSRIAPYPIK